jgi:hypothetical protein
MAGLGELRFSVLHSLLSDENRYVGTTYWAYISDEVRLAYIGFVFKCVY